MSGHFYCVEYLITKKDTKCTATASWGTEFPTHCFKHAKKEWKLNPSTYCFDEKRGGRSLVSRVTGNDNGTFLTSKATTAAAASKPATMIGVTSSPKIQTSGKIQFHNTVSGNFQLFSTMAITPFLYTPLDGEIEPRMWPSVEHAFNAMRYFVVPRNDEEEKVLLQRITEIQTASTPSKARTIGKSVGPRTRSDWEYKDNESLFSTKHLFMFDIMKAKFDQHPEAKKLLLSTGNKVIEEITPTETHWGIGKGTGKNYLGKILMALRSYYNEVNN